MDRETAPGQPPAAPGTTGGDTMTTRREFLQDTAGVMAGIAFVGCGLMSAAPAQAQARRRDVVVNGRRVKTVDVHAHCAVPEAMALMGLKLGSQTLPPILHMAQAQDRIRAMDEQGIDVEALSINPYWYTADRDVRSEEHTSELQSPCNLVCRLLLEKKKKKKHKKECENNMILE